MTRMYSSSVRRQIVARLRSGEPIAVVAAETGVCQATIFRWRRQALFDAGAIEGIPSVEADELAAAHKRVAALEAESALTRDACELFDAEAPAQVRGAAVHPVRATDNDAGFLSRRQKFRTSLTAARRAAAEAAAKISAGFAIHQ